MEILTVIIVVNFAFSVCGLIMCIDSRRKRKMESKELTEREILEAKERLEARASSYAPDDDEVKQVQELLSNPQFISEVGKMFN